MGFDFSQPAYRDFRSVVTENSDSVVAWVGAGLSAPAGLPSWAMLRQLLLLEAKEIANREEVSEIKRKKRRLCEQAEREANFWISFTLLAKVMGAQSYIAAIRRVFKDTESVAVPEVYRHLWRLGISGMINLNIDRLAKRAFTEAYENKIVHDFNGKYLGDYIHLLRSGKPWLANLHGEIDSHSSWVFTSSELESLFGNQAYDQLIKTCFAARTVVFVGISADDIAAGEHLRKLTLSGVDCGGHFWITHDLSKREWAESSGIRQIHYSQGSNHAELLEIFSDLRTFVPADHEPIPVASTQQSLTAIALPEPRELEKESAARIRQILNAHASNILKETNASTVKEFEEFANKYSEAIYRAWYVDSTPPKNELLGYSITDDGKAGAFGTVYRATDNSGQQYAIKVLHEKVRKNREMLQSFRRGVASLRILTSSGIDGVVSYLDASEIPAMVVMEFIEGIDLVEATRKSVLREWQDLIRICTKLTSIIRASHRLPQRVLHRDIRPANVMIENCWGPNPSWENTKLWVLDFDLSHHLEAYDVSVSAPGQANGYLAPEQVERQNGISTRNATVDSYGLGMTFYFLRTGAEPRFAQHRYAGWAQSLENIAFNNPCETWHSLPFRFSRLILNATRDRQEDRLEVANIEDELMWLDKALVNPSELLSAEMFAEELAARGFDRNYEWNHDKSMASMRIGPLQIRVIGDEKKRQVAIEFEWLQFPDMHHQDVKRWIPKAQQKAISLLKNANWNVNASYNTGQFRGTSTIDVLQLRNEFAKHEKVVQSLRAALSFN